jgi:hypothetical protein
VIFHILIFPFPVLSVEYCRGNARGGECGEVEARMRSRRKGPLGRVPLGMREEREESSVRKRGGWERGLVSLSLLILRGGAARTSSSIPPRNLSLPRESARGKGEGGENENERWAEREPSYTIGWLIPFRKSRQQNVTSVSLYQARDCDACSFKIQDAFKFSFVTVQTRPLTK